MSTVSLGKPSSAALEKVCAQTETLLDETAKKTGGAAAFINVRQDFLQPEQTISHKTPYESFIP
jgi:Ran-binding protein 9/10